MSQPSDLMGLVVTGGRMRSAAELMGTASLTSRYASDTAAGYTILVGVAT